MVVHGGSTVNHRRPHTPSRDFTQNRLYNAPIRPSLAPSLMHSLPCRFHSKSASVLPSSMSCASFSATTCELVQASETKSRHHRQEGRTLLWVPQDRKPGRTWFSISSSRATASPHRTTALAVLLPAHSTATHRSLAGRLREGATQGGGACTSRSRRRRTAAAPPWRGAGDSAVASRPQGGCVTR